MSMVIKLTKATNDDTVLPRHECEICFGTMALSTHRVCTAQSPNISAISTKLSEYKTCAKHITFVNYVLLSMPKSYCNQFCFGSSKT